MPQKGHKKFGGDLQRLMSKLKPAENGCLEYQGAKFRTGYGVFEINGKTTNAHRVLWELVKGAIPERLHLDHLCRNRACCNLDHLEAVPTRVNTVERAPLHPSYALAERTHCKHGHEFTPENTFYRTSRRGRICRVCNRINSSNHYYRKKERGSQ